MTSRDDEKVRAAFRVLRDADVRIAPSMSAVRGRAPVQTRRIGIYGLAAAAAIIAVLGVMFTQRAATHDGVSTEVIALSHWRAPTDAFLPTMSMNQGNAVLGASLLDVLPPIAGDSQ